MRRKPFWKLGVLLMLEAGRRAVLFDQAEQRRLNRRHGLNLTNLRRIGKMPRIFPNR